jgi:hypothetical protein
MVHYRNHEVSQRPEIAPPVRETPPPSHVMGPPTPLPLGVDPPWLRWLFRLSGLGPRDMTHRAHWYIWGYAAAAGISVIGLAIALWLVIPLGDFMTVKVRDLATHEDQRVQALWEFAVVMHGGVVKLIACLGFIFVLDCVVLAIVYQRLRRLFLQGKLRDLSRSDD